MTASCRSAVPLQCAASLGLRIADSKLEMVMVFHLWYADELIEKHTCKCSPFGTLSQLGAIPLGRESRV